VTCRRCQAELEDTATWCAGCDREFDAWSRQYASDIIVPVLAAMIVVMTVAVAMPLLGMPWIFATTGVFAGFGALVGISRWNRNRRRKQFLRDGGVPRAYLPEKT
jgi:hypothetical protein